MQNGAIWATYEARLRRVSSHICGHLDEDLDMDRLAEIACLTAPPGTSPQASLPSR